jgi:C-22 sterol desaturase
MEGYKKQWNSGTLSAVSVFNIFIVMAASNEYSRKILNSPAYTEPCLFKSAKTIFLPKNWVFLNGKAHVDYRRGLNTLFTRKALSIYLTIQESTARKHLTKWLEEAAKDPSPKPIMMTGRSLNMETSLRVFCGDHIPGTARQEIFDQYWDLTAALELVNFPFAFPGTKVYKAVQARKVIMNWLELAACNSKIAMANDGEPQCMVDEWVRNLAEPSYKGKTEFSDNEMAMVLFSFLLASQDAMSSGLIYGFQHLADHPDVLAKVRQEQDKVRKGDYEKPVTLEMIDEMTYLQAVMKESLRMRPPVTMVPYRATKAFPISSDYTVPANSMIIPSFYPSLHDPDIYPDPDAFDPERWLDSASSANTNPKNYLVWGAGPHRCIAPEYATMNMALVLATASIMFDWEHHVTKDSSTVA